MLLARIGIALVIHGDGHFLAVIAHFRDRLGDEVMVLHGLHRQIDAGKAAHLAGPQACGIDHDIGADGAIGRHHVPGAIGAELGFEHRRLAINLRAVVPGALGIGLGHARRIDMAIDRLEQGAEIFCRIDERVQFAGVFERNEIRIEPHVARLGALLLEIVEALRSRGQIDAARAMDAAGLAGERLQFLVELDGVALQARDVGVGVDGMNDARRMPGRARRQFLPFQQHHVLPPHLGEVIEDGAADHASPDDDDARVTFHGFILAVPGSRFPTLAGSGSSRQFLKRRLRTQQRKTAGVSPGRSANTITRISASRTGSCGGPSPGRTSCAPPRGCRVSRSPPS